MGIVYFTRKCTSCGKIIQITEYDADIIVFKNKAYHTSCFEFMCKNKIEKNNRFSPMYIKALQDMQKIQKETQITLKNNIDKRKLNDYLVRQYNIMLISANFWQVIEGLKVGIYKNQSCVPVDIEVLLKAWQFYQGDLTAIKKQNTLHGKSFNGEAIIRYDLAIILSRYTQYIDLQKQPSTKYEASTDDINYKKIPLVRQKEKENLSDIMNEIFD